MEQMPQMLAAGFFDSRQTFPQMEQSPLRTVVCYELELHINSSHTSYLNGVLYPMPRCSILLARPGDQRYSLLPFQCRHIRFQVDSGELCVLLDRLAGITPIEDAHGFEESFLRIQQHFLENTLQSRITAVGELLLLIARTEKASDKYKRRNLPEGAAALLFRACQYMDDHYAQDLSAETLAKECSVSASYLYRLFAQVLDSSPHQEVMNRRISAAKRELVETQRPISEIAWRCGFSSPAYFSDCFKRAIGVSPAKFRKLSAYPLDPNT